MLSFSSASDGYLVIGSGVPAPVLRTENGGRTWVPELLPNPKIRGLEAAGTVDYAIGEGPAGGIFQTTVGGMIANRSTLSLAVRGASRMSRAQLRRAGSKVSLTGRLTPASGGETVIVSYSSDGATWRHKSVTVSSSGTFAATVTGVSASTNFVAQWRGNDLVGGAGTPATRFTVTR